MNRSILLSCLPVLLACLVADASAQGTMRSRPAPERPPVTEDGCMLELVKGSSPHDRKLRDRAEREAKENWESHVRRAYGPDFAHWKHSARHTRDVQCKTSGRGLIDKHWCWVQATPCEKR